MGKGKLSGSPFHIETVDEMARGSVNCRVYNPPPQIKIECQFNHSGRCLHPKMFESCLYWKCPIYLEQQRKPLDNHMSCIFKRTCRRYQSYCTRRYCRTGESCFSPKTLTPQEEVSAIEYRISITQSDLVRELLVAYLKGESSTLQTQNIQNPAVASQYSKSACLIRKTAMKAYGQQNKQLNNNLYQAWKQYLRLFTDAGIEIIPPRSDIGVLLQFFADSQNINNVDFIKKMETLAMRHIVGLSTQRNCPK